MASSASELYAFIQEDDFIVIEDDHLSLGYEIGKKKKFFKLPLVKNIFDRKDAIIAKLKQEEVN